jgi:hypothetical protein
MPALPAFFRRDMSAQDFRSLDLRAGFTFEMWLDTKAWQPGCVLLDSRDAAGRGVLVSAADEGRVRLVLHDGQQEVSWSSDRAVPSGPSPRHVVMTVDGGPKIITFVVDGVLSDGGDEREYGWGRFSPTLQSVNGASHLAIGTGVITLRIYRRPLRTSEAVGNFRAGCQP